MTDTQLGFEDFIPQHLAIKAMRDSGYKSTAHALAELIDNSVQAKASNIEVICLETSTGGRPLTEIAVLDDGFGMDVYTLEKALQFGNGNHLEDRDGIGRFGMGLPNASISQCGRVTVWSWQSGVENACVTYLDVDDVMSGDLQKVPQPRHQALPDVWLNSARHLDDTGTLVVWSKLDFTRLSWKTSDSILNNLEDFSGRTYRKFISAGTLGLHLSTIFPDEQTKSREARVNDPMYLSSPTYTPPPYNETPMFQPYIEGKYDGEAERFPIRWNNNDHEVIVRASYAKHETNTERGGVQHRGDTDYGKHARKNQGVSVMRAGRELELNVTWTERRRNQETDRWWGIEVEFPPELDEVFGVTNNKQSATIFSGMSDYDYESEMLKNESYMAFLDRLLDEGDSRGSLLGLVNYLQTRLIPALRSKVSQQNEGSRGPRHPEGPTIDDIATAKIKEGIESGEVAPTDNKPFDKNAEETLIKDLTDHDIPITTVNEIIEGIKEKDRRMIFISAPQDSPSFFNISADAGNLTQVIFNKNHAVYDRLVEVLNDDTTNSTSAELVERIENASDTLWLLFGSFARWEMLDAPNKDNIRQMRWDWGRQASKWINKDD